MNPGKKSLQRPRTNPLWEFGGRLAPKKAFPVLTGRDLRLLSEGRHFRSYEHLGARPITLKGKEGVHFAVWAPNARRVSVVGKFNGWKTDAHPMTAFGGSGYWSLFIPGIREDRGTA